MIFLFAPGFVNLVIILAIALREQFTFRRVVPMLDQIDAKIVVYGLLAIYSLW